jgi:hypothetical protein
MSKQELPAWRTDNLYSFFVAICVGVFAFAGLYFSLSTKFELLAQRQEYMIKTQEEYNERNKEIQIKLEDHGTRLTKIETFDIKSSDESAVLK